VSVPEGYMQDAAGRLVPVANVRAEDRLEDELVRALHERARLLQEALRKFRDDAFEEVAIFQALLADKFKAKVGGAKGNLTLSSFDGSLRVQLAVNDTITFGPELQAAKALIDECLEKWSQGANENIRALVMDAFDVRKTGRVQVGQVLRLRRLQIDDPVWQRAMAALGEAIRPDTTKSYVRLYQRRGADGAQELVPLDVARV
jgi:Protein of unknown function (DUF3164)